MSAGQSAFDVTLLPLNLSEGRNIGDLSGLFLSTAPKKSESSRQSDIFIALFFTDNNQISEKQTEEWFNILTESYFSARGSFTMGISNALKRLSAFLAKQYKGTVLPTIFLNIAILRNRNLFIAHAGPVHTTVISSNSVKNFSSDVSLPVQITENELSFFNTEVHSEDIILLCPRVPSDWTNTAIMEVTGDSPLNAIRFLLDRSGGNLQAAVIQLKTGKGQISFRKKTTITTNVRPENENKIDYFAENEFSNSVSQIDSDLYSPPSSAKPLIRVRRTAEQFLEVQAVPENKKETTEEKISEPEIRGKIENKNSLTGTRELPGSDSLSYKFSEDSSFVKKKKVSYTEVSSKVHKKESTKKKKQKTSGNARFNTKRLLLIILCGLLIPLIVVSTLFFVYSGRSKNELHRQYLSMAVENAQKALSSDNDRDKEGLWTEVLADTDQAINYGSSPAVNDLRQLAVSQIDLLNGGISTVYNYANNSKLPQGLNLTDIFSSGQYTYALDSTSGSVIRLVSSGNGLSLDNSFTCSPGNYKEFGKDNSTVQVGKLVDFILLPSGNPHSFLLAGIDANANILYCSAFKENQAEKLQKPATDKFVISGITYSNNAMYILDTQASRVWEYTFSSSDGFAYEPSDYYGSYSPYLSDITDFAMFKEYAYFLKANGTLLMCDYTGYRPSCQTITEVDSSDGSTHVVLSRHLFSKIIVNNSPDNSLYLVDTRLQSVLNLSVKANYVRYIVPNRTIDNISQYSRATGFGITGQNRLLWSYKNDLYIGNMP